MGVINSGSLTSLVVLTLLACDAPVVTPATPDDVETTHQQQFLWPDRAQVDVLFVIDNSNSMCEAQDTLTRDFGPLADRIAHTQVDLRIAVISTDMNNPNESGRFLSRPASPVAVPGCHLVPNTADCPPELPKVISLDALRASCTTGDVDCLYAVLERQFRCHATLGTAGHEVGRGLEAMRRALFCGGPNGADFTQCCEGETYNPDCAVPTGSCQICNERQPCPSGERCLYGFCQTPEPKFLRPDAVLVVLFVSDTDDCSEPVSWLGDIDSCAWHRDELIPVADYYRFLVGLKARPSEQLVVASFVGPRDDTERGEVITYHPPTEAQAPCLDETGAFLTDRRCDTDEDCPGEGNACADDSPEGMRCTGEGAEAFCCPQGACPGRVQSSCESASGFTATAGHRYLALAELFGANGIGCNEGTEGTAECVHICQDGALQALQNIRNSPDIIFRLCLEKPPLCQLETDHGPRPCETEVQRDDPANYALKVSVQRREANLGGQCHTYSAPQIVQRPDWDLNLDAADCPAGTSLEFRDRLPPGAKALIEYEVDTARAATDSPS